jgi:threonyl-tRNA synthetase
LAEFGYIHRYELSGTMHGLLRVRSFTMDDAHIFCTPEQIEQEVVKVLELAEKAYKPFNFNKIRMAVSTRPEKYIGSLELWDYATNALKQALEHRGIPYFIQEGEGAFYGPKIEIKLEDTMGREWQCGTVQIDPFMPQNFKLEYIDSDQSRKTPIIIHRAILGSLERFIGVILEHTKGLLPFWLAPVQIRALTITDQQKPFALDIINNLQAVGIRAELDQSSDQISAKIRTAQLEKVQWMLVIGAKEATAGTVTLRYLDGKQETGVTIQTLIERAKEKANPFV